MNRRDFTKILGLFTGGAFLPRRETEMKFGDLLGKLARGDNLTPSEILWVERLGNEQQMQASRTNALKGPSGALESNALDGRFGVLPHETAGVTFMSSVASGTPEACAFLPEDSTNAAQQFEYGIKRDFTNNRFEIHGTPGKSVFMVGGWVLFNGGSTAFGAQIISGSGATATLFGIAGTSLLGGQVFPFCYFREATADDDWYQVKVNHFSGVGSSMVCSGQITVTRLR